MNLFKWINELFVGKRDWDSFSDADKKTFSPFILFSKKRYIGNLYEFDLDSYKQKSMGIVLKRRDNADIVKHIYGKVIDIIMNKKNLEASI